MKAVGIVLLAITMVCNQLGAQRSCKTAEYQQQEIVSNPGLTQQLQNIEEFTRQHVNIQAYTNQSSRLSYTAIIRIPVVIHVIYHSASENINEELLARQIEILNRDYRKRNADTTNIPARFAPFAADCQIEFQLASVDPKGRSTTGIVRKYSPIAQWSMDDKVKLSSELGDDGWDPASYLNIWVCNIKGLMGYSSIPGDDAKKDGVVLNTNSVGGRTLVHEAGHWLNLKHIWGDADCGDDLVDDTPKQRGYTPGCPGGIRKSCGDPLLGDMYMNYMDFTSDACLNMFTYGQRQRMRSLFEPGGGRYSILFSKGLGTSLIAESPLPDAATPQWMSVKTYPNPAINELNINFEYDIRWIGKEMVIANTMGQVEKRLVISSATQKIDISHLKPGIYFIRMEKEGERVMEKFVKL